MKLFIFKKERDIKKNGYAALISLLLIMGVSLTIISGLGFFTLKEVQVSRTFRRSTEARYVSEGGIEDVVYRLMSGKQYSPSETVGVGEGVTTVTVTTLGNQYSIHSEGKRETFQRNLETKIMRTTTTGSFVYGLQVGRGGLKMENTSQIVGSVYSAGDIKMSNSSQITGDAFAALTSRIFGNPVIGGSARGHRIDDAIIGGSAMSTTIVDASTVTGTAQADSITTSVIGKDAYYFTSIAGSTVAGTLYPGTPPPADLPEISFPISDAQITQWETDAAAGGTYAGPCPYVISGGTTTLGPIKINCDFKVQNTAQVIVNGPIWVAGNIDAKNSAIIKLAPSYGSNSEVIIADNPSNRLTSSKITVQNSAGFLGSGTAGSYFMVLSQNNSAELGGSEEAITPKNGSNAAIYYAIHGKMLLQNSTALKEATAYYIHIKNSSVVTYESGLSSVQFSSGPSGSYDIRYWKETQ